MTTTPGFGLNVASGKHGIKLNTNGNPSGTGDIVLTDKCASTIFASGEITSTGTTTGTGGSSRGIYARSRGTTLTIAANNATGGQQGIYARQDGTDALSVTSSGTATATASNSTALYASNFTGTDLTVVSNNAGAHGDGIIARHVGTGALSITSTGTVSAASGSGINALNYGTSLAITANEVSGGNQGIVARNFGTEGLTITASGDVTGTNARGIFAYNSQNDLASATVINQAAGITTSGYQDGIVVNNARGSLTINTLGTTIGRQLNAAGGRFSWDWQAYGKAGEKKGYTPGPPLLWYRYQCSRGNPVRPVDHLRPSRRSFLAGSGASAVALSCASGVSAQPSSPPSLRQLAALPFDMADVTLHDGPFLHAQRMTERYLLSLSPDRMLHNFRVNAGLEAKAPVYGGWESEPTWADINCHGHTLGHYLSACALAYRATGTAEYRQRIDYIASELAACQDAADSGLVTAFPQGATLVYAHIAGEPITGVPWYTLHKIYAGLRDAAELAGSERARAVLIRLADWGVVATSGLSDEAFEAMLATEHGGMNEIYADLYVMTGAPEYRALAERFSHKALLVPLAKEQDHLDGLHANTQVPKVVGFERVAQVGAAAAYHEAAEFFWQTVARTRSYATGGHGDGEHFFAIADVADHAFSAKGSETCCQHNMAKLTRALFQAEPRADYADFYERTLFNGILGSQDPDSGMATYFQGARPGYMKLYHTPEDSFWCCTGTGMENHVKYRDSIYFHDDAALWVNLFVPSTLEWRAHRATLTQETRFPDEPGTRLLWSLDAPAELTLKLRHPGWSRTVGVLVNGEPVIESDRPGRYLDVTRRWRDGDRVELKLEMAVTAEPLPAAPHLAAFTYGPLVLAAALGTAELAPGSDIVINERKYGEYNDTPMRVPQLRGDPDEVAARIEPIAGAEQLTFTVASDDGAQLTLVPYHRIAHQRYATYWDLSHGAG